MNILRNFKEVFNSDRRVALMAQDGVKVSTVRLAINLQSRKPPLPYETMVFGGEYEGEYERYATLEEARAGHARMVAKVFGGE